MSMVVVVVVAVGHRVALVAEGQVLVFVVVAVLVAEIVLLL